MSEKYECGALLLRNFEWLDLTAKYGNLEVSPLASRSNFGFDLSEVYDELGPFELEFGNYAVQIFG